MIKIRNFAVWQMRLLNRQLELDPQLGRELDEMAKKRMYQDVVYNLDMLYTALALEDGKNF